jgi:hypothetical protein
VSETLKGFRGEMNKAVLDDEAFAELPETERFEVWRLQQVELWTSFITNPRDWKIEPIAGCGMCFGPGHCPTPQSWPQAFECPCGATTIADKGLPDGAERFSMFSEGALTTFARFLLPR